VLLWISLEGAVCWPHEQISAVEGTQIMVFWNVTPRGLVGKKN
jgi:hypothetical protein